MSTRSVPAGANGRPADTGSAWLEQIERPLVAWSCFAAAAAVAVLLIGASAGGAIFVGDDWAYLHRIAHQSLGDAIFDSPPGQYLVVLPMLIYAGLAELFGADSYVPYRIAGLLLLILAAGLFLELGRRRAGYALVLPAAALLLFFGSAYEVIVVPMRIPSLVAICAGLGMLLALDRRDARGDVGAAALGIAAVISHPVALAFIAAAAVRVVLDDRSRRWSRAWVVLVPAVIYGLWMIALREPPAVAVDPTVSDVISFAVDFFVVLVAAVTGVFHPPWTAEVDFINGWSVALAVTGALAVTIAVARSRRISPGLLAALAAFAVGLVSPALAPATLLARVPETPRFIYPGALFLFIVGAELVASGAIPRRPRPIALAVATAVLVSAAYSNVALLTDSAEVYAEQAPVREAELGALDLARSEIPPVPDEALDDLAPLFSGLVWAGSEVGADAAQRRVDAAPYYFEIEDALGSPAASPPQLREAAEPARAQADQVLAAAVPLALAPASSRPSPSLPPAVDSLTGAGRIDRGCLAVEPRGDVATALLSVPPGRVWFGAEDGQPPMLTVGRLADQPSVGLPWSPSGPAASVSLPALGLGELPWKLGVETRRALTICSEPGNV